MRAVTKTAVVLAAFVACVGSAGSRALAQNLVGDRIVADVPFKFIASGKTYDAGKYEMKLLSEQQAVELRGPVGTKRGPAEPKSVLQVMTRLPGANSPVADSQLVFDKVGGTYYLAEMWMPGEDGFVFFEAKAPHAHSTVKLHKAGRRT